MHAAIFDSNIFFSSNYLLVCHQRSHDLHYLTSIDVNFCKIVSYSSFDPRPKCFQCIGFNRLLKRNPNTPALALYQNSNVRSRQRSSKARRPGEKTAQQLPVGQKEDKRK